MQLEISRWVYVYQDIQSRNAKELVKRYDVIDNDWYLFTDEGCWVSTPRNNAAKYDTQKKKVYAGSQITPLPNYLLDLRPPMPSRPRLERLDLCLCVAPKPLATA